MSRGWRVALGAAVVLIAVVVSAAWVLWPRNARAVSEDEALADFHERSSDTPSSSAGTAGPSLPSPGVYRYRADGEETVQVGVLPGQTRPLADRVTAVVVGAADRACFDVTLNLFAEHVEDTTFCVDPGGVTMQGNVKHQQIGAISAQAKMTCDPEVRITATAGSEHTSCSLEMSAGPASLRSRLEGAVTVSPVEEAVVGSDAVRVVPVEIDRTITGDMAGRSVERFWFDATTWLPVRIEREMRLSGFANFDETSRLVLESTTPTT